MSRSGWAMIHAGCPYCYHDLPITEDQWGATVKCPHCANFFDTDLPDQARPQPARPPAVLSPGEVVQDWGASHCPNCHRLIPARAGRCPYCVRKRT